MAKSDRRTRYTKQVIKQSLLEMLRSMPIEQITVKALCEKAEINRATFYNHYETLTLLLEEIEYESYKGFADLLNNALYDDVHLAETISSVLQYLKDNPNMREVFLSKTVAGRGLTRLLEETHQKGIELIIQKSGITRQQAHWTLIYISSGTREVLRQWFADDMPNEDLLIETLISFIRLELFDFLQ